jgi:hypothetical protein
LCFAAIALAFSGRSEIAKDFLTEHDSEADQRHLRAEAKAWLDAIIGRLKFRRTEWTLEGFPDQIISIPL